MATRFVLDELDFDLPALSATLLVVIVVIVARHGSSWSFGTARIDAIASEVVARRRMIKTSARIGDVGHLVFARNESSWTVFYQKK